MTRTITRALSYIVLAVGGTVMLAGAWTLNLSAFTVGLTGVYIAAITLDRIDEFTP